MELPTTPIHIDVTDKTYTFIDHDVIGGADIKGPPATIGKVTAMKFFCNNFDVQENICISGAGEVVGDFHIHSTLTVDEGVVFNSGIVSNGAIVGNLQGNADTATCATTVAISGQACDYVYDIHFKEGRDKDKDFKIHSIGEMYEFAKEHHHLPTIMGREEYEKKTSIGFNDMTNQLWQTIEVQSLYINELHERLNKIEIALDDKTK